MIGSVGQLCGSFFHIEATPEDGIPQLCLSAELGGPVCARKTVCCVARVQAGAADGTWVDKYVGRYFNCWQGNSQANLHAEHFLLQDAGLAAAVGALDDGQGRLLLYLTYQPCHHSGGHRR